MRAASSSEIVLRMAGSTRMPACSIAASTGIRGASTSSYNRICPDSSSIGSSLRLSCRATSASSTAYSVSSGSGTSRMLRWSSPRSPIRSAMGTGLYPSRAWER